MFSLRQLRSGHKGIGLGLVLYLLSLFMPLVHAAEFGEHHDHGGQPCHVQQMHEAASHGLVSTAVAFVCPEVHDEPMAVPAPHLIAAVTVTPYASRAPPA